MQPPQLWFAIPGLGMPRPGRRWFRGPATSESGASPQPAQRRSWLRRPAVRLPTLGPRVLAGLVVCLLVLVPGLLAAELVVWGYEARLTEDARTRAMAGLDGAAGLVDAERTRALNNAD